MANGQRPLATSIMITLVMIILSLFNLGLPPAKGQIRFLCKPVGPIDCDVLLAGRCSTPKISLVHPFGVVTPQLGMLIEGCGFGEAKGSLIFPLKDYKGNPKTDVVIQIDSWNDNAVSATFLGGVSSGVMDQITQVQIVKHNGVKSAAIDVKFQAIKEAKMLPQSDVIVSCSNEADEDACNGIKIGGLTFPECLGPAFSTSGVTISAWHWTGCTFFGGGSNDDGTDVYSAILKNGWVIDSSTWQESADSDWSQVHPTYGFAPGMTGLISVSVDWIVHVPDGWVSYDLIIFITGPKGVPH